jgi:hypothetical protein
MECFSNNDARLIRDLSNLDESEILQIKSKSEFIRKATPNILELVSRIGETELREYPKQIARIRTVLNVMESVIKEQLTR